MHILHIHTHTQPRSSLNKSASIHSVFLDKRLDGYHGGAASPQSCTQTQCIPHTKTDGASLMGFPDTWSLSPSRVSDPLAQGPRTRPELLHLKNERVNNTWSLKSPSALTPQVLWGSRAGGDSGHFSEAPPPHTHCPPEGNEVTNPDGSGPKTPPRNPDF